MTAMQQRNNRALPIFIKFRRSRNDKRVNKLSSRISSGISSKHFCIEFDIMTTIKVYEINLMKSLSMIPVEQLMMTQSKYKIIKPFCSQPLEGKSN